MKCPHCNQEHPNDTKFCPETGMKMPSPIVGCSNKDCINYCKSDIPPHYKYCPECGSLLIYPSVENIDKKSCESQSPQMLTQKNECSRHECDDKKVADTCMFVATDQKKNINVVSANNHKIVYEGKHNEYDVRFLSEDGHDVVYIKYDYPEKWIKITSDGNIQKELTWEQTSMCNVEDLFDEEDFLRKFPNYTEAGSIGYLKNEKVHVVVTGNESYVEVRTSKGQLLFILGNPDACLAFPYEMTSQGLIIVENEERRKGLWDLQGKEILPCIYKSIENVDSKELVFSEYLKIYDGDKESYFNIHTKEQLSYVTKYNKFQIYEEGGDDYMDVYDFATNQLILKHICHNPGMTEELVDGWYRIHEWEAIDGYMHELSYILVKGDKYFRLPHNGEILEEVFSSGMSLDMKYYISQNRIITSMKKDDSDGFIYLENMEYFAIRDYNGNLINKKKSPTIWPLHPYCHDKVLAFKMKDDVVNSLVYLDLQGKEHHIPNTAHIYIESPYTVANEGKCIFVSEDTFILNCSDEEGKCYRLMDINGNVLIDKAWNLEELSNGYILYEKDFNKMGVVDPHGYEVLRPLYKGITIIRGRSINDKFQKYRLFH